MTSPRPRTLLIVCAVGGAVVALPQHVWMHKALPGLGTLLLGALAGLLPPLFLGPVWRDLPTFLGRGLSVAVAGVGVLSVGLVGIAVRGPLYVALRRDEVIATTLSLALISVGVASLVETHRRLAAVIATREQELAAERRASVEARLRALQAQIRPHFLFNTFNALSELIHSDANAAEDLVTDLAHLLRYSLRSSADGEVPLGDEMDAIRRYLRIEQARLGDRLHVELDVPADLVGISVPGLILQPIVENAVQHAVAPREAGGRISVRGRRSAHGLLLIVEDDGPGLPPEVVAGSAGVGSGGHGGGFANVRHRLGLRFGDAARMDVSTNAEGTRIELHLPEGTP